MNIPISYLLVLLLAAVATPCRAQTGKVTFYSIGHSVLQQVQDGVIPVGRGPFTGWLFDGGQRMAHAQRGRFMTFSLAAGEHQFTVPYDSNGPGKKPVLQLKIENGGHYCVRLSAKYANMVVLPVAHYESQIEEVSCQQALNEARSYKPIEVNRVDPAVLKGLERASNFPPDI